MHLSAYLIKRGMPNRPCREIEGYFETALKGDEVVSYEGKA
jgi:hypothetical protein